MRRRCQRGLQLVVRSQSLVESAAARPRASAFGADAYPSLALKAALLHSLVRNQALVDGNKRLAWLATVVFSDVNTGTAELSDEGAFNLVIQAAEGSLDVEQISPQLCTR